MSDVTLHAGEGQHEHPGFIGTYLFSLDHKMIGKQFLITSFLFMLAGGLLAMALR